MFKPNDLILYYSLLIPQEYIIDITTHRNQPISSSSYVSEPRPWYENKALITNDNIFDINDLNKIDTNDSIDGN